MLAWLAVLGPFSTFPGHVLLVVFKINKNYLGYLPPNNIHCWNNWVDVKNDERPHIKVYKWRMVRHSYAEHFIVMRLPHIAMTEREVAFRELHIYKECLFQIFPTFSVVSHSSVSPYIR